MAQGSLLSPTVRVHAALESEEGSAGTSGEGRNRARDAFRRKMVRSQTPPPRLNGSNTDDCISPRSRARNNSRDYTHSYDGNYGGNEDMIGVDLARTTGGWWEQQKLYIFWWYVVGFSFVYAMVFMALTTADGALASMTFTVTNIIHFSVHLVYLHWMKGGYMEMQGELEAMTLWEQIEATPGSQWLRFGLRLVPTVLCYCACYEAQWESRICFLNGLIFFFCMLGKFSWMNGVRIFGINRHPAIDVDTDKDL